MSNRTYRDGLAGLVVDNVARRYDQMPAIDTELGDLPAQWVRQLEGDHTTKTYGKKFFTAERTQQLVIAVRPIAMGSIEETAEDLIDLADHLETALDGAIPGVRILSYTVAYEVVTVGGVDYAAVVASITGNDA
jgi:hypothetical protein